MTTDVHPIRCACGSLAGTLTSPAWVNRVVCYCNDCQAFARHLEREAETLDPRGGSDIVQTVPAAVTFTHGQEHLACLRLTPNGLLRWYAGCCRTPIGNTPANPKFPLVGLLHNGLGGAAALDAAFGPPVMRAFTNDARGEPKPSKQMPVTAMARLATVLARARLSSAYRTTPFFDASGAPVVAPVVVSEPDPL